MVRQEGILALWKGNGVTVLHRIPYSAINFWAYERLTELYRQRMPPEKSNATIDCARRLAAGGLAGSLACAVVNPLTTLCWCYSDVCCMAACCNASGFVEGVIPDFATPKLSSIQLAL